MMMNLYYSILECLNPRTGRAAQAKRRLLDGPGIVLELGAAHSQRLPSAVFHAGVELTIDRARLAKCDAVVVADAHYLPFREASIDRCVGIDILHHTQWKQVWREMRRVVKRGGLLRFVESNPRSPWCWWTLFIPAEWGIFRLPQGRRFPVFLPRPSRFEGWLPSPTMILEWTPLK